MAWKPKKPVVLSPEERAYVQKKLEDYKKFFKPIKGEFIYKIEDYPQEVVATARYYTEEDIKKDAENTIARMNANDKEHRWTLVSWRVVNKFEYDDGENNDECASQN